MTVHALHPASETATQAAARLHGEARQATRTVEDGIAALNEALRELLIEAVTLDLNQARKDRYRRQIDWLAAEARDINFMRGRNP